jgi:DNA mismatch repair protein MutS
LSGLEEDANKKSVPRTSGARRSLKQTPPGQLSLFAGKPPVLEELEKLDIDSLTPLEAITKLYELRRKAREE